MDNDHLNNLDEIIEAVLFATEEPLTVERLCTIVGFEKSALIKIKAAITRLEQSYQSQGGVELVEVASGYRFQAKPKYTGFIQKLQQKKPPKYSQALLETLALIAYRQPISRGEIELVRGVSVNTYIIKTLLDRDWIKVIGTRDVPGKPALFATTKQFLNDFNLKSLSDLPPLEDFASIN